MAKRGPHPRLATYAPSPTDWPPSPAYPGLPFGASLPSPTDWGATHWPKGEAIPLPHLPDFPQLTPRLPPTPPTAPNWYKGVGGEIMRSYTTT